MGDAWPTWLVAEVCWKTNRVGCCLQCLMSTVSMGGGSSGCCIWGFWERGVLLLWCGLLLESQNHAQPLLQQRCWAASLTSQSFLLTCTINIKRGPWFAILDFIKNPSTSPDLNFYLLSAGWGELPALPQGLRAQHGLGQRGTKIVWQ